MQTTYDVLHFTLQQMACFVSYSGQQLLVERQYKLVEKCTKSVEIGTAPFTSSTLAMAIIGLKGENIL